MKVLAGFFSDEGHQVAGVAEFAEAPIAAGQIAPQGHDAPNAGGLELFQFFTDGVAAGADATEVRRALLTFRQDGLYGLQRAFLGGAAGPIGDRAELGLQRVQGLAHGGQFAHAFLGFGREELQAQGQGLPGVFKLAHVTLMWMKNSRLPSPPVMGLSIQFSTRSPCA